MSDLNQILQVLQPRLRRHRPLARGCPQLLFDLAGLLSGVRSVIMLDTAPGATPDMLQQALQPLTELLPDFQGCILHLDGCCYLANIHLLNQQLSKLSDSTDDWPIIVKFSSGQAAMKPPDDCGELQQQVKVLVSVLQQLLHPAGTDSGSTALSSSSQQCSKGLGISAVIDLEQVSGLPVMPTLNGILLGYPVVYWVRDAAEAAAASRELSVSVLQLFTVLAICDHEGCSDNGQHALLSFTIPSALCSDIVTGKVKKLMDAISARAAESGEIGGVAACARAIWHDVKLSVEVMGPRPVSL